MVPSFKSSVAFLLLFMGDSSQLQPASRSTPVSKSPQTTVQACAVCACGRRRTGGMYCIWHWLKYSTIQASIFDVRTEPKKHTLFSAVVRSESKTSSGRFGTTMTLHTKLRMPPYGLSLTPRQPGLDAPREANSRISKIMQYLSHELSGRRRAEPCSQ